MHLQGHPFGVGIPVASSRPPVLDNEQETSEEDPVACSDDAADVDGDAGSVESAGVIGSEGVDGRSARKDRNLEAVIDAAIALVAEGNPTPTTAEVAARSGVSQRSVNRYFGDVTALLTEVARREVERGLLLFWIHSIGKGPREHRIRQFVEVRVAAQQALGGTARAALLYTRTNAFINDQMGTVRQLLRDQVARQFAFELDSMEPTDGKAVALAFESLFSFESLDVCLGERNLPPDDLVEYLIRTVRQLLSITEAGRDG